MSNEEENKMSDDVKIEWRVWDGTDLGITFEFTENGHSTTAELDATELRYSHWNALIDFLQSSERSQ